MKFREKEEEIQICFYGDNNICSPINEVIQTYQKYNEKKELPNHKTYAYLNCNETELSLMILIQENNCFNNSRNETYSQFTIESNRITEIFYNESKCQTKDNTKENNKYECGSCINNMTMYCEPFISNEENNHLTSVEIINLSIICIVRGFPSTDFFVSLLLFLA